jgi:hypothetical protein
MNPNEEGEGCGVAANEYGTAVHKANGAQLKFGDLTLYLTYEVHRLQWAGVQITYRYLGFNSPLCNTRRSRCKLFSFRKTF